MLQKKQQFKKREIDKNGILYKSDGSKRIEDNALVALTLMIDQRQQLNKKCLQLILKAFYISDTINFGELIQYG